MPAPIPLAGRLIGRHTGNDRALRGEVVHVPAENRPAGPAENAYVYVEVGPSGTRRARYISWINLYDIEHANRFQAGCWSTIEPSESYRKPVAWLPFGWNDLELPSVADPR